MTRRAPPEEPEDRHPLFPEPRARSTDPRTSHAAAASVEENQSATIRWRVLGLLQAMPRTDEEVAAHFAFSNWPGSPSGIRTRRKELVAAGLVSDSGEVREMASGRVGIVWRAVNPATKETP